MTGTLTTKTKQNETRVPLIRNVNFGSISNCRVILRINQSSVAFFNLIFLTKLNSATQRFSLHIDVLRGFMKTILFWCACSTIDWQIYSLVVGTSLEMAVTGDWSCSQTPLSSTSGNPASYARFTTVFGSLLLHVRPRIKKAEKGRTGGFYEGRGIFEWWDFLSLSTNDYFCIMTFSFLPNLSNHGDNSDEWGFVFV